MFSNQLFLTQKAWSFKWSETIMTMAIRGESLSVLCQYLGSQIFHDLAVFEMVDVVAINFHHVG